MGRLNSRVGFNILLVIFGSIVLILCGISLFRMLQGLSVSDISFAGFLEFISTAPPFHFSFSINTFHIGGSWGIIDFLREFLNGLGSILGVFVYLLTSLLNFFTYIFYFITYLFV